MDTMDVVNSEEDKYKLIKMVEERLKDRSVLYKVK